MQAARIFTSRADYVSVILEAAYRTLENDPDNNLYYCLSYNISGGHEYWGREAQNLYQAPQSLEEALLALELRSVLELGILNQLGKLWLLSGEKPVDMGPFGFPVEVGIMLKYIEKLAMRDATNACMFKMFLSTIAERAAGIPLVEFLYRHSYKGRIPRDIICQNI